MGVPRSHHSWAQDAVMENRQQTEVSIENSDCVCKEKHSACDQTQCAGYVKEPLPLGNCRDG